MTATVSDTAGMIRVIDRLSVEVCDIPKCWCSGRPSTQGCTHSRYTWSPGDPIVRFDTKEAA